ncbi:hypothetical protein MRX96_052475 [Rhipicephalus microplus]
MKQSSNAYQPGLAELASSPRSSSPQRLQVPEIYTEPLAQEKSTYATVAAKAKKTKDSPLVKGLETFLCLTGTL